MPRFFGLAAARKKGDFGRMTIISKLFYAGTDIFFSLYLFLAPPVAWLEMLVFFMFGRAMMTLVGASIPPYTMASKVFYGGTDVLMGLFLWANAADIGSLAGNIGSFLIFRGFLTWINIEI